MIESGDKAYYGFVYQDDDGKRYKAQYENTGESWTEALEDFIRFLESIYKYDIKSQVKIKAPAWANYKNIDWFDPWENNYFYEDEDDSNSSNS